jgi:hypothetical protein
MVKKVFAKSVVVASSPPISGHMVGCPVTKQEFVCVNMLILVEYGLAGDDKHLP